MSIIDEAMASVDAEFSRLDAPSWPDPHEGRRVMEEEYGRVTDPGRFRALRLRLEAWRRCLAEAWGVDVAEPGDAPSAGDLAPEEKLSTATTSLWTSAREGTLPLRTTVLEDGGITCVALGIADDPVDFGLLPGCACDACDTGSDALLAELDALLVATVTGSLVVVIGPVSRDDSDRPVPRFLIVATEEDWSLQGDGPAEPAEIVDAVRSGDDPHLPVGSIVHCGRSWLSRA
ncbi:MAG: DUF6226 family protein [Acidipropionibacterium jensenii]|uniref:DUF6226 family protein n=1 Tax=Acidipropionibacterium jensenii TaxID=1749 RepID=UPI000BC343E4|nr:DUF6226 family protein [Acidipropionibacterium jensenii]AZZ40942.1 hypothetical protein C0Z11_00025 [Acidipropionibacterium jensenii]MDN6480891.1 DUF6226 family protein [Acidipropionibacterium jensenii]MDN6625118.1 DUF6226 family protein [Acidipropionibacterium jensenii]